MKISNIVRIFGLVVAVVVMVVSHRYAYKTGYREAIQGLKTDTIHIVKEIEVEKWKPEFIYRKIPDTFLVKQKINLDSLWEEARKFWQNQPDEYFLYSAVKDTSFEDSSVAVRMSFVSPMPLHPESFFDFKLRVKERIINNYSVEKIYADDLYLVGGAKHDFDKVRYYIGGGYEHRPFSWLGFGGEYNYNTQSKHTFLTYLKIHP